MQTRIITEKLIHIEHCGTDNFSENAWHGRDHQLFSQLQWNGMDDFSTVTNTPRLELYHKEDSYIV